MTPVPSSNDFALGPPPCFFWSRCRAHAELEKQGKSVCRACAKHLNGRAYPLRPPTREPLYSSGRAAAEALHMLESGRRRELNRYEPLRRAPLPRPENDPAPGSNRRPASSRVLGAHFKPAPQPNPSPHGHR